MNWGAVIDPSTVIWWLKQSSEARSAIVNDDAIPLQDALLQFREFVSDNVAGGSKKAQVWGNGASFDNSILRSSYDCIAEDYPWEYWNDRDVRTMVELGHAINYEPQKQSRLRANDTTHLPMLFTRPGMFLQSGSASSKEIKCCRN